MLSDVGVTRQSSDTGCKNGSITTSLDGLKYTQYCDYDLALKDLSREDLADFPNCIDSCTAHQPACFGVAWDRVKRVCYLKSFETTVSDLVGIKPGYTIDAAVVNEAQYSKRLINSPCPYPNLSVQKSESGMSLKIFCGGMFVESDVYRIRRMHLETLEECMEQCAQSHPLCTRLIFNSNLVGSGWLNCRLLGTNFAGERVVPYTRTMAHSAEVILEHPKRPSWRDGSIQKANSGKVFRISRNDLRELNTTEVRPFKVHHENSIEDCMQRCSGDNETCVSAVYDHGLQSGYQNCYLFSSFPSPRHRNSEHTFMYLEALSAEFKPPPRRSMARLSTGQIIGVSLGSVAALIVLTCLIMMYKKRSVGNGKKFKFI